MAAEEARGRPVTMVSAPAGAGKTMLLAQRCRQLQREGIPVGWVSLDGDDNDSFVLWSGVLTACADAVRTLDTPAAAMLDGLSPPSEAMNRGFLASFLAAIDSVPDALWLVLDDVHEIISRPALHGLDRLLRNVPARLRLMLGCRYDPPLPLPRLMLEGDAWEIRARDLAFDRGETRQLLLDHGIRVDDQDIELLLERTEGWAAGIRLAALSLARQEDPSGYIARFAGDERPVADYLVSEVLAQQPPEIRNFLLATAVPEWLTVELAGELSERDDAGAILDQRARDNALVYCDDSSPRSYHYHSLLRSYLLAELGRRDATARRRLHSKASDWFANNDLPAHALDHAAMGRDWDRVVGLLDRYGLRLVLSGDSTSLSRALRSVPEDVWANPVVSLTAAVAALQEGQVAAAERHLDRIAGSPAIHADGKLRLLHAATRLHEARLRADPQPGLADLIAQAGERVADQPDHLLYATAQRGMTRLWIGDHAAADADLTAALSLARQYGRDLVALDCLSYLAVSVAFLSDFGSMRARAEQAIAFATERGWASSARMVPTYQIAAWATWHVLDTMAADRYISLASAIDADIEPEFDLASRVLRAFLDFESAMDRREVLARLRRIWSQATVPWITPGTVSYCCLTELHMALSIGEAGWANETAARAERLLGETGDIQVMRASVHAYHGREGAARKALDSILSGDVGCHIVTSEITAWLLEAHRADVSSEPARAHAALIRALNLAAPRRAMRPMYDLVKASARVRGLLIHGRGRFGAHEAFVQDVLDATREPRGTNALALVSGEALTARELELLRDLPSLLSLKEIAQAHVVSVDTIKTHIKSLYRKLRVGSRREAVDRARELGLL